MLHVICDNSEWQSNVGLIAVVLEHLFAADHVYARKEQDMHWALFIERVNYSNTSVGQINALNVKLEQPKPANGITHQAGCQLFLPRLQIMGFQSVSQRPVLLVRD